MKPSWTTEIHSLGPHSNSFTWVCMFLLLVKRAGARWKCVSRRAWRLCNSKGVRRGATSGFALRGCKAAVLRIFSYHWVFVFGGGAHKPPGLLSLYRLVMFLAGAVIGVALAHMLTPASSFEPAEHSTLRYLQLGPPHEPLSEHDSPDSKAHKSSWARQAQGSGFLAVGPYNL